ncbi:MAG: chemotaxis-specific protein-glutamate methyltransferase CheB [Chloroflexota bacterium]
MMTMEMNEKQVKSTPSPLSSVATVISMPPIRVMIVDDSVFMRQLLKKLLEHDAGITVIEATYSSNDVLARVKALRPDVLMLSTKIPVMQGLTTLAQIMSECPTATVMFSSNTAEGALTTFEALELGAVDYFFKPDGTVDSDLVEYGAELISKIRTSSGVRLSRLARLNCGLQTYPVIRSQQIPGFPWGGSDIPVVVMGASAGGPRTLLEIIPQIPFDFPAPIVIMQDMSANFTSSFANRLDVESQIRVKEAAQGETLAPGCAYIAPGGFQLRLNRRTTGKGIKVHLSEKNNTLARPSSVNGLFQSVAQIYGLHAVGVLLSGSGEDGVDGMLAIHNAGGSTIAESEETAIVFGLPGLAIERGGASMVLPSQKIAEQMQIEVGRLINNG